MTQACTQERKTHSITPRRGQALQNEKMESSTIHDNLSYHHHVHIETTCYVNACVTCVTCVCVCVSVCVCLCVHVKIMLPQGLLPPLPSPVHLTSKSSRCRLSTSCRSMSELYSSCASWATTSVWGSWSPDPYSIAFMACRCFATSSAA